MQISRSINRNGVQLLFNIDYSFLNKVENMIKGVTEGRKTSATWQGFQAAGQIMLNEWSRSAEGLLKSSQSYKTALEEGNLPEYNGNPYWYRIEQYQKTKDRGRIESLALILEYGFDAFDMKPGLLKGKQKAIIKFDFGSPTQNKYERLPKDVYAAARLSIKKRDATAGEVTPNNIKNTSSTIRVFGHLPNNDTFKNSDGDEINKAFSALTNQPSRFPSHIGTPQPNGRTAYEMNVKHSVGKYSGLVAHQNMQGRTYKYSSYRAVSSKSDPNSWIHPGLMPKLIFQRAFEVAEPQIMEAIERGIKIDLQTINAR